MKGIFITGTGTDIGKTFISALLVKKLKESGMKAGYYKAALSGAKRLEGQLIPGDAAYVCSIAGINKEPRDLVSFIYEAEVSPHLAAKIEGNPIDLNKVQDDFQKLKNDFEIITVEGSGGIICPLRRDDKKVMLTDVIKLLNLDIIIVASSEVGTINSTLLTVEYARKLGIGVKGIILNGYDKESFVHQDNKLQIEELTGIKVIACISEKAKEIDIDVKNLISLYKEI